jgi:hypothetical protein
MVMGFKVVARLRGYAPTAGRYAVFDHEFEKMLSDLSKACYEEDWEDDWKGKSGSNV